MIKSLALTITSQRLGAKCKRKPIMSAYLQWRHAEKVLSSCRRDRGSSRSALLFRVWLGPNPRVHQPQEFGHGPRQLPILTATVAKVENRTTPKIARQLIFRLLYRCNAV